MDLKIEHEIFLIEMGWQESNFSLHQYIALSLLRYSFVNVRMFFF